MKHLGVHTMKVSIFGMGYVGLVTAACVARKEIGVIGVDVNPDKLKLLSEGKSPIVEPGLPELLKQAHDKGLLEATTSAAEAVRNSDISLICVGTPSRSDGALNLATVQNVCATIGKAVASKGSEHTVILRSTVVPGTTVKCAKILEENSGGVPVHVGFNPEFLREGSSIYDFDNPPYTVIGSEDPGAEKLVREIYEGVAGPVIVTHPSVAEMIKLTANAWHATKIAFANEIGRLARTNGVDGREVMDIIMRDTKLNVSKAYMRPGFAYGGSCLPKDVRALTYHGRLENVTIPLLNALEVSNESHIAHAINLVADRGKKRIGLLGLAFKSNTDDLRESPAVELAERLIGKGFDLRIFDPAVQETKLMGTNLAFIEEHLAHLSDLLVEDPAELIEHAEVVVVSHGAKEFGAVLETLPVEIEIVDVSGFMTEKPEGHPYVGIAW